jgi:3-phosphoshikimate 1-carboxyvinyltransferase
VTADHGRLPLSLHGPTAPVPSDVTLPVNAPIAKAALILAALNVPGTTLFTEAMPGSNHAERMLARFGAATTTMVTENGRQQIEIAGLPALAAQYLSVPGDTMLAATGAVACSIVPGSEVEIEGVLVNPARTALLSALVAMGASIEARNVRDIGGEEVADLTVRHVGLRSIALAPTHTSRMLDELPLLAIAAACAEGETVLNLPPNLPFLRLARHADLARGLVANGVEAEANDDAIVIRGTPVINGGGSAPTTGDALLGIAFLVLGMAANEQVTIDDQSGIEERFPGFVERFENIGASFIQDAG